MKLLFAIVLAAASSAAGAQNWVGLLKNTPAERFDEDDLRIFMDSGRKALNETPDGKTLTWENPKTKAYGEITVVRTYETKGMPCKELRVHSEAGGRKGDSQLNLCKLDGKWRLLSPPKAVKK